MRKIFSTIMLIAAAAMTFTSCQREEMNAPKETFSTTLQLNTEVESTKTYFDDNAILWGKGEAVSLYVQDGAGAKFVASTSTDDYDGQASASFTFNLENITEAESYTLGGIYPASVAISDNKDATKYKIALSATQNASVDNYDPSAFIMVLKPDQVETLPTEYTASFRRAVALNKITLTNVKEAINSVEITVPEDKFLAGRRYVDLTTADFGEIYNGQTNKITVSAPYTETSLDVWFTSWGVELAEGEKLTVKMTSATKTYTRTIEAKAAGIRFVEGDLNTLTINMSEAIEVVKDNFAGEYLIVNADLTSAASAWNNGNNLPEYVLTVNDGVVLESEGLANCKMTISLQNDGTYTIMDAKGKYLYAASSSSNHLKGQDTPSKWTIVKDGDNYVLTSSAQSSRNIMRYNSQSKIFSCYSSGQDDITLYRYSDIKPDTTPKITVTEDTIQSIGSEGGNLTFTCTLKNLDGQTLTVEEASEFLTYSISGTVVTITVSANEAEQRTLNATIKCGAVSVPVTITQAGKSTGGSEESAWVSKSFLELQAGDQVVIVSTKGSNIYAMSNDNGTSSAPVPVPVKYSNNKLSTEPAANTIWYVGVDGENRIFYADAVSGEKWLYCTSTNNGVRVGTNSNKNFVLDAASGYLKHVATGRYLGVYNNQDWRCYTNTTGNTAGQTFQFFVKVGDSGNSGETPEPEEPKVLASIAVSNAKTEYYVGDDFVAPTIKATYEDGSTATVTATFSGYDLSQTGTHTVAVSYTENEVTKETSYEIIVTEAPAKDACAAPEISCANNTVTITAEAGATIYYTTNGDEPSTSSAAIYESAFKITETVTVKAIAVAEGKVQSVVASNLCTFDPNAEQPGEGGETTDPVGGTHYVKVTSAPADWTGEYLIVYETGNVAFNGSLSTLDAVSNTVTVTITEGKIVATEAMKSAQFTIDASGNVKSASGYYIGQTSNANGLKSSTTTTYSNTLSINADGSVNVVSGGAYLRYNATSGQYRFRYYKSSSYTSQKAIHLYKLN